MIRAMLRSHINPAKPCISTTSTTRLGSSYAVTVPVQRAGHPTGCPARVRDRPPSTWRAASSSWRWWSCAPGPSWPRGPSSPGAWRRHGFGRLRLDLDRLGLRLDGHGQLLDALGDVLDALGGLAAPGPHGLLTVLGDLLVGLAGLDGVLGGHADAAQREVLGVLAELLQVRVEVAAELLEVGVEGADEPGDLGLQGLLRLLDAGGGLLGPGGRLLLDGLGVGVAHGVDPRRGLGCAAAPPGPAPSWPAEGRGRRCLRRSRAESGR